MNKYIIYFEGSAEYIADTEEEAMTMFENDHFGGYAMNVEEVEEEEVKEDD